MKPSISLFVLILGLTLASADHWNAPSWKDKLPLDNFLSYGYYHDSCPEFEAIVQRKVKQWTKNNPYFGPALLRLVFHDCMVTGCDASILLDYDGSERRSPASRTLKGFEVIDDIKKEIEGKCPGVVSCADILTAASRDATVLVGGPYWSLAYGRKDSNASYAKDAEGVPSGRRDLTALLEIFQSYGLNILDLVVLSGAHTIGRATCGTIQYRLYNHNASGGGDPTMNTKYLDYLQRKCRWASDYVDLDVATPTIFDNEYYKNLQKHEGLLSTDQQLYSDPRTAPLVAAFAEQPSQMFRQQFGVSMTKMTNIGIITGEDGVGEVRKVCSKRNSY